MNMMDSNDENVFGGGGYLFHQVFGKLVHTSNNEGTIRQLVLISHKSIIGDQQAQS